MKEGIGMTKERQEAIRDVLSQTIDDYELVKIPGWDDQHYASRKRVEDCEGRFGCKHMFPLDLGNGERAHIYWCPSQEVSH